MVTPLGKSSWVDKGQFYCLTEGVFSTCLDNSLSLWKRLEGTALSLGEVLTKDFLGTPLVKPSSW